MGLVIKKGGLMEGVNLFNALASDAMKKNIHEMGEQKTLKVIKELNVSKETKKVYLKAFFQEVQRRENNLHPSK